MKSLSCHCNITNPEKMGFPYLESIQSFANLCDEVIVVDGGSTDRSLEKIKQIPKVKIIEGEKWDRDFDWSIMPKNLQKGYEACSGDWAFHFDVDYIFHEDNVEKLKTLIERVDLPGIELYKNNCVLVNEDFKKNYYPLLLYKSRYPTMAYGVGYKKGEKMSTFLSPITKKDNHDGVMSGDFLDNQTVRYERSNIPVCCYDFTFMTKEQVIENRVRFMNAVERFGNTGVIYSDTTAFKRFIDMMKLRHDKNIDPKDRNRKLEHHSKFIKEKVKNIQPEMFGYNGWGLL
jgi:glycosyltransferase involved in cell wall biosynthesis